MRVGIRFSDNDFWSTVQAFLKVLGDAVKDGNLTKDVYNFV